jgi:hypothetical protein
LSFSSHEKFEGELRRAQGRPEPFSIIQGQKVQVKLYKSKKNEPKKKTQKNKITDNIYIFTPEEDRNLALALARKEMQDG